MIWVELHQNAAAELPGMHRFVLRAAIVLAPRRRQRLQTDISIFQGYAGAQKSFADYAITAHKRAAEKQAKWLEKVLAEEHDRDRLGPN